MPTIIHFQYNNITLLYSYFSILLANWIIYIRLYICMLYTVSSIIIKLSRINKFAFGAIRIYYSLYLLCLLLIPNQHLHQSQGDNRVVTAEMGTSLMQDFYVSM